MTSPLPAGRPRRLPGVADLVDATSLRRMLGGVTVGAREALPTGGLSGAAHERIIVRDSAGCERHLILKTVVPAESWTAYRSGDMTGREAQVLAKPALDALWEVITSPYLAYAMERDRIGLLMDDLSPWLLPPGGRLSGEQEDCFLRTLAVLHARFWRSDALALPWLAPLSARFSILAPGAAEEELRRRPHHSLFTAVARGWEIALDRVPATIRDLLLQPAEEIAARYANLPATLLHGDAKTGNCAFLPGGRIALFDWATAGPGPATIDLYYFLAVDVARHARMKDAIIARYREFLAAALDCEIPDRLWQSLQAAGIVAAARMLLWAKALALESGDPLAHADWAWWIDHLSLCLEGPQP